MGTHLHITNGDGAASTLKLFCVGEDVLPWRDSMIDGPFPAGLNLSSSSKLRAAHRRSTPWVRPSVARFSPPRRTSRGGIAI